MLIINAFWNKLVKVSVSRTPLEKQDPSQIVFRGNFVALTKRVGEQGHSQENHRLSGFHSTEDS